MLKKQKDESMKIKDVLNVKLEDNEQSFGGIDFAGETVKDFIESVGLNENMDLNEFNKILCDCGIKEINMTKQEREAILDNGMDIDISKISSCNCHSMDECEKTCRKYYGCSIIAYANDLLVKYERGN